MKPLIPSPEPPADTVPEPLRARWRKAEKQWNDGDTEAAATTLADSPTWPDDSEMLEFAGKVFLQEDHAAAEDFFEEILFKNPRDAAAHSKLAQLYRGDDRETDALEHEKAAAAIRASQPPEPPASKRATNRRGRRARARAVTVACAVHAIIALLLALWIIGGARESELMGVRVAPEAASPTPPADSDLVRALAQKPRAVQKAELPVIAALIPQEMFLPDAGEPDFDTGLLPEFARPAVSEDDAAETGENDSEGSHAIEFFGRRSLAKRVVFIVDFSASMTKGKRLERLKRELSKALSSMPDGMLYNVIYYADHAWIGGTTRGGARHRVLTEKLRWRVTSRAEQELTRREIQFMGATGATFWGPPMRLAMTLDPKPDLIWLMSDGDAADREALVRGINHIVGEDIRINTVGMELGGNPFLALVEIADKTGGDYSLIMRGVQYHGEKALPFTDQVYDLRRE